MNERAIFEKLIPEPTTLLGLRLKQLSLGHVILLNRVESAFVLGGEPSFDDLALSVFICSRSYAEALEGFDDPELANEMARWERKLSGRTWFRRGTAIDLLTKWAEFLDYMDRNSFRLEDGKDYARDEENTRRVHLPEVHVIRVKLQSRFGLDDDAIFNRPWSWCQFDYYALADMDGIIVMGHQEATQKAIQEARSVADKVLIKLRGANGS